MNGIKVSICCLTYNHEAYIREALDSFLMQRVNFKYEILVHDDASTDDTASILKQYRDKFPDKIRLILQTENQYSIPKAVMMECLLPKAEGKYIALCEGDDYWTSSEKLQKQFDYMESTPACTLCIHAGVEVDAVTNGNTAKIRPKKQNQDIEISDIIMLGVSKYPTASMFFRSEYFKKELPAFFKIGKAGDLKLCLFLAEKGRMCYLDEFMCAYRNNVPNSEMTKVKENPQIALANRKTTMQLLNTYNEYSNFKFDEFIQRKINREYVRLYEVLRRDRRQNKKEYRDVGRSIPFKDRFKVDYRDPIKRNVKKLFIKLGLYKEKD